MEGSEEEEESHLFMLKNNEALVLFSYFILWYFTHLTLLHQATLIRLLKLVTLQIQIT